MKVIVFGPAGGTGRMLVETALASGHSVTAFARNTAGLAPRAGLTVITGSVFDVTAVDAAIAGQDAVLSALGGRPWRRAPICMPAIRNIAPAMTRHGLRRIVVISTNGAGETRANVGWFERNVLFGFVLKHEVADKEAMEQALAGTDLDWTVVRVGMLNNGPATARPRAADDGSIRRMGKVARADVAAFMVAQLESGEWSRRKPVLVS
jgi:putative NADH-flavin reductase